MTPNPITLKLAEASPSLLHDSEAIPSPLIDRRAITRDAFTRSSHQLPRSWQPTSDFPLGPLGFLFSVPACGSDIPNDHPSGNQKDAGTETEALGGMGGTDGSAGASGNDSGGIGGNGGISSTGGTSGIDSGHEGGNTGPCQPTGAGTGLGTPASPYTFKVLVYVEKNTKDAADALGWDIPSAIQTHFAKLNAGFNNGQLANSYNFVPIDVQYPTLDINSPNFPPRPSDTPENEDFLFLYDERYSANEYGEHTIRLGGSNLFDPASDLTHLITHECGHARGAIDLYRIFLDGKDNQVFLGAAYTWGGTSYMGISNTAGTTWDPLSVELIKESQRDPNVDVICAYSWLPTWVPPSIKIAVTDASNQPISNTDVEVYRIPQLTPLTSSALWYTGTTDAQGILQLPKGLTACSSGFYNLFLGAVHYNGQYYLNWYDVTDIAIPYRKGVTDLTLPAKVDDSTLYQAPPLLTTDLKIQSLTFAPAQVKAGEILNREVIIHNNGPDSYNGDITIQYYLSTDSILDTFVDKPIGGYNKTVVLNANADFIFDSNPAIASTITPGDYYLIVVVTPSLAGATDPDNTNNTMVSAQPVTILAP